MIINFIGSPNSGKTSVSSMIFSNLKDNGINCEFLVEEARKYIATKKFKEQSQDILLTNSDQILILEHQREILSIFNYSSPNNIIILDSCPLNALFYLKDPEKVINQRLIDFLNKEVIPLIDIVFYCTPLGNFTGSDPNRIHTKEQSLEVDKNIINILSTYCPAILTKMTTLVGDNKSRCAVATGKILENYCKLP